VQFGLVVGVHLLEPAGQVLFSRAPLDGRYLGPSLYRFQLAAFLDHLDRSQLLVIASEVRRDRPPGALTAVFGHLAVDPAAVGLDGQYVDNRSMDKPSRACAIWAGYRTAGSRSSRDGGPSTHWAGPAADASAGVGDSAIPRELRDKLAGAL
jgi:hypothetical protein